MSKWLVGARDRGGIRIIRAEKAKEFRTFDSSCYLLENVPLNSTAQLSVYELNILGRLR